MVFPTNIPKSLVVRSKQEHTGMTLVSGEKPVSERANVKRTEGQNVKRKD
jgi:hypothetical protein